MSDPPAVVWMLEGRDAHGRAVLIEFTEHELQRAGALVLDQAMPNTQLSLFDAAAGHQNAEIALTEDGLVIGPIGRSGGVEVNGKALDETGPVPVAEGDVVRIGGAALTVRRHVGGR